MRGSTLATAAAVAAAASLGGAEAHSWVECADLRGDGSCQGFTRNWFRQPTTTFGQDQGWDQRPGKDVPEGLFCGPRQQPNANVNDGYTDQFPMAQYKPGSTVTLLWPAKNHATVNRQFGVQLFIADGPGVGDKFNNVGSTFEWIEKFPKLGGSFSNCDPNRPNLDKIPCTGNFEIPADLEEGIYTFMWWWEFNQGEFYNSCFDVKVTQNPDNFNVGGGPGSANIQVNNGGSPTVPPEPINPTVAPPPTTGQPTPEPTPEPTLQPTLPTYRPTPQPTFPPNVPTNQPTSDACNNFRFDQCGGANFNGQACCKVGDKCTFFNDFYSQCQKDNDLEEPCPNRENDQCFPDDPSIDRSCCPIGSLCVNRGGNFNQCIPQSTRFDAGDDGAVDPGVASDAPSGTSAGLLAGAGLLGAGVAMAAMTVYHRRKAASPAAPGQVAARRRPEDML